MSGEPFEQAPPRPTFETTFNTFVDRYQRIQAHRDTTDELIKDVLIYAQNIHSTLAAENADLRRQVGDLQLDLSHNVKSRRELQQQVHELETENELLKTANPYVAVLIDGDGLLFKEHWIRQGIDGGRKAAAELRAAVLDYCGSQAGRLEIIIEVYANLASLSRVMKSDGSIDNEADLGNFFLGFSRNTHCTFVDVGSGKEEADERVRETANWHLRNHNCKHVVLGCSHDSGYAPFINNVIRRDGRDRQRVSILEGFPTHRLLKDTGLNIMSFPDLFRSDKLVDRTFTNGKHSKSAYNHVVPNMEPLPAPAPTAPAVPVPAQPAAPSPVQVQVSVPAPAPASYAARAMVKSASPPPQMTLPIPPKPKPAAAQVAQANKPLPPAWNPGPRGLDPPILYSKAVMDKIKTRKENDKLCNNHYLRGPCAKGNDCCFEHNYKPSEEEKKAIAFLARLNPCTNGQYCELENCIYGHHCPSVEMRPGQPPKCTHPYCKFEVEDHPPGTVFPKARKDYDNY
ncbi:hypothetical protein DL546_006371 [Coniochaeta pulveracea]|uniref:C3H1-type domain-containing protein n=1 Tax=Coniochaeta pulveracea TaxID=177199 RepID=A0A420Y656_9PEZI|nr:hypothetical protein DL546_006371 [Coniochaeta pulveracea]